MHYLILVFEELVNSFFGNGKVVSDIIHRNAANSIAEKQLLCCLQDAFACFTSVAVSVHFNFKIGAKTMETFSISKVS
jgi:hypothetical protein